MVNYDALIVKNLVLNVYLQEFGIVKSAIQNMLEKHMIRVFKMGYICFKCKKEIERKSIERRIICPYCGSRIVSKARPSTLKKVKAR
jgi:DNA-directed RNA polymerase subunit RPC12/RpoP